ncbi:MAG: type II toxin-antitoxin system RelE/ParE family toxin [Acidobacteria bacterium]|nr:type II toxin-antitoxin system RelE/ParE family toxin [Acidobacteriota bacterium]
MRQKLVVRRRRADDDIELAISYYLDEAGTEIASAFLNQLEEAIRYISRQPAAGSQRYGYELQISDLRQWPIKRFPYLIFYVEKERCIEIARVLHSKRDIPSSITLDQTE